MKKIILFAAFIFSFHLFAQKGKVTYTGIVLIDSLPEELLPAGASELGFILANENNQPVGFGFEISEFNYEILGKFGKEYDNFAGVEPKAFYRNDTIFFWSHIKYKDVQTYNYYSWDTKKLTLLESVTSDPSKEAAAEGEAELRKKNVREASILYNKVKYVPAATEAKTAYQILSVAHYLALEAAWAESYKEAVEYMDGAFVYHLNKSLIESADEFAYNKIVMANFDQKQADSLGPWIAKYALFLYKADSLEKSIKIAAFVNMCYPKMTEAYLVRADALYDQNNKEESKPFYDKYLGLMTLKGEESQIPPRVGERLKEVIKNE